MTEFYPDRPHNARHRRGGAPQGVACSMRGTCDREVLYRTGRSHEAKLSALLRAVPGLAVFGRATQPSHDFPQSFKQ